MSDELEQLLTLKKGTPEYAIVECAYDVVREIRDVRKAVSSGDTQQVTRNIAGLRYFLRVMRRIVRDIADEMKDIEGKQPLGQPLEEQEE